MIALTVDLEDYFQVYNFHKIIRFEDWDRQEIRLIESTKNILKILDESGTKATFFALGWNAEKFPSLIKEIKDKGHEIACHGYNHKPIFLMTEEEFSEDIDKAIKAIKKACGVKPKGYRAPSFSITKKTLWALDILSDKGFEYDSSMINIRHPDYGIRGIPNKPFKIREILEIPITTTYGFPVGGGYFRIYPYFFSKFLMKRSSVFYIHPWEFDPKQVKHKLPLGKRFRHYYGLKKTEKKFRKLVRDFKFGKMNELTK